MHHPLDETERMRALRERGRHGSEFHNLRNEDDLRVIAEHGHEGATSTDHDQRAHALSRFITDMWYRNCQVGARPF